MNAKNQGFPVECYSVVVINDQLIFSGFIVVADQWIWEINYTILYFNRLSHFLSDVGLSSVYLSYSQIQFSKLENEKLKRQL